MNNVERIFNESKDAYTYAESYLQYVCGVLKQLDIAAIAAFIEELEDSRKKQGRVFFIGNGGSAATASHMANDFGIGSGASEGAYPYKVLSLVDNIAKITAIANDSGYENVFTSQLKVQYEPGDKLVVISASGNSSNLIAAVQWVRQRGGKVIGFLGFDGGKLKDMCDLVVCVETPKGEYGPVEDAHMVIDHLVYTWLRYKEKKAKINEFVVG